MYPLNTFVLLFFIVISITSITAIEDQKFSKGNRTTICGQIVDSGNVKSLLACSEICSTHAGCKGILHLKNDHTPDKCQLVTSDGNAKFSNGETDGFDVYSIKAPGNVCNNLGIGVPSPSGWGSGCPRVYFPLDSAAEGTVEGGGLAAIQFVSGKVGNSFYFPNPDANIQAYFNLGSFPVTNYCFPDPERCIQGVSFAFWLNLLAPGSGGGGQITTIPNGGPGFLLLLNTGSGPGTPHFIIRRDSDSVEEIIGLNDADFQANYGHDVWVHYILTYKYDGTNAGNNMELYINGKVDPAAWKNTGPWPQANTADFSGTLDLGAFYTGSQWWGTGNLKMDELIIFEEQLPCEDTIKLYEAYQS